MQKYEIEMVGRRQKRVKALRDFGNVKAGSLGGIVSSERNLSQNGNCWISYDSKVLEYALVADDAQILEGSTIKGNALILGKSVIINSNVSGRTMVNGESVVSQSNIRGHAIIKNSKVDNCEIRDSRDVENEELKDMVLLDTLRAKKISEE